MAIPTQNNNLNYLIDPTFTKVNRMFVLSLKEMLKEIIEILFALFCTKRRNKRFQCLN